MPDGFPGWAWTDIQKSVMVLARGGNMLGVQPGKFVSCCTDGFRPVFFLARTDRREYKGKRIDGGYDMEHIKIELEAAGVSAAEMWTSALRP